MKLNFKTDRSISRKGFKIEIKSVCGTYLSAEQGVISSPGFPNNYGNNLDCFYGIRVRPGRTLTFWFDTMNVTSSNTGKHFYCKDENNSLNYVFLRKRPYIFYRNMRR